MKLKGILFASAILIPTAVGASNTLNSQLPSSGQRIAGGEPANLEQWPWMVSLNRKSTSNQTSITIGEDLIYSYYVHFTAPGDISAQVVDCGLGERTCANAEQKICVIQKGELPIADKLVHCEAGGGIGAILWQPTGTISDDIIDRFYTGDIPVVGANEGDVAELIERAEEQITMRSQTLEEVTSSHGCGATYLGSGWVLTAAHCVDDDISADDLSVVIGEYDLTDNIEQEVDVKRLFMHPLYDSLSFENDIALLQLTSAPANENVTLASAETISNYVEANSNAYALGWGASVPYEPEGDGFADGFPDILHQVELNLVTNEFCVDRFGTLEDISVQNQKITKSMMCTVSIVDDTGPCKGDSGGPLMVETDSGWQQFGIVSWGRGCAADQYPHVYTHIPSFSQWVTTLTQGIASPQSVDFGYVPVNSTQTKQIEITNSSNQNAILNLSSSNDDYSVSDNCQDVAVGDSCTVDVTYSPTEASFGEATELNIEVSNDDSVAISQTQLEGHALSSNEEIQNEFAGVDGITWYTGGDGEWKLNETDIGVSAKFLRRDEEAALIAQVNSSGVLTYESEVSRGVVYIYVNGKLVKRNARFDQYETNALLLDQDVNTVVWVYTRPYGIGAGTAEIKSVYLNHQLANTREFGEIVQPKPVESNPHLEDKSHEGGSTNLWTVLLVTMLCFVRRLRIRY